MNALVILVYLTMPPYRSSPCPERVKKSKDVMQEMFISLSIAIFLLVMKSLSIMPDLCRLLCW